MYLVGYGIGRFWVEGLRIDEADEFGPLRFNQWVALVVAVLARGVPRCRRGAAPTSRRSPPAPDRRAGRVGRAGRGGRTGRVGRRRDGAATASRAASVSERDGEHDYVAADERLDDPDPVLYERREPGIALLTLNRPERLNAWNGELAARYFELLDQAAADPEVKVIVVTGAGRGFCAGADMDTLQGIGTTAGIRRCRERRRRSSAALHDHRAQAGHRRGQRCLRRHRHGAGAHVRHPLRRRRRQVHDSVLASRPDRRVRHVVDPAAPDRHGACRWTCCSPVGCSWPRRPPRWDS